MPKGKTLVLRSLQYLLLLSIFCRQVKAFDREQTESRLGNIIQLLKSSHLYLYITLYNTDCVKAASQCQVENI